MINPLRTPFGAIFQNEVLLNRKRVAPYAMAILFAGNALLWWARGPAVRLGWAINSDYNIVRNLLGFSFLLGLPIFTAVIMGDPVIRDFRAGVDPLIFSKPVTRAQYLLAKFFGSFFVLVCCQAAFPLTLLVLQAFRTSAMVVQPVRVFPYFKHFFFFVVISHLVLAAFYLTAGTLTRNSKIVYGLAACFYPLFITYGLVLLRPLPWRWRALLDPMLLGASLQGNGFLHTAEFLNQYVVPYTADMITNRLVMILASALCLAILYVRFTISEPATKSEKFSVLSLSTAGERVYYDLDSFQETHTVRFEKTGSTGKDRHRVIPLPEVARANEGIRANVDKLLAALAIEFRLLLSERSLVVIMPLALILSTMEVVFWSVTPDPTYSAEYAGHTARSMTIFLLGISIFYTGEAMHRDRELRVEPVLWVTPAPDYVLLLSKFGTTLVLTCSLITLVGLTAFATQLVKGHSVDIRPYLLTYSVILIPSAVFLAAVSVMLHVLLRDKYVAYALSIGLAGALFHLYSTGHNHWLYNPLHFQLWSYADLTGGNLTTIVVHRLFWLGLGAACLLLAHLCYQRRYARLRRAASTI
jgi:ABC-type transport system involved in multi-copper enzyme maturation permease subunit